MISYEEKKAKEYFIKLIEESIEPHKKATIQMKSNMATIINVNTDSYEVERLAKEMYNNYIKETKLLKDIIQRVNVSDLKAYMQNDEIKDGGMYLVISKSLYALDAIDYLNQMSNGRKFYEVKKQVEGNIRNSIDNKIKTTIKKPNSKREIAEKLTINLQGIFKQNKHLEAYVVSLLDLKRFDAKEALKARPNQTGAELQKAIKELPIIDLSKL